MVEDLGSSNGIEINDVNLPSSPVRHGDLIKAGSTYLRFYERDETAEEASHDSLPVIDGYEIYERIGVGGMGEVYRACQLSLEREVAIKTLSAEHAKDRDFVDKFFSEARASGNLNHANIVQVHDVGESGDVCYICMEYVGGGDLTGKLRESDRLTAKDVVSIITDVAKGLEYAEGKGIVHCDIKPDNIMFTTTGTAKIADLGIARSVSGFQERRKEVFGSPHYMAPEQARGKPVDHRADLYSLGCTMFRMLAGRTPFSGASAREVMKKQVVEEHPDILGFAPDCPAELADIIDFLMEKNLEDRCPSATELLRLLENVGKKQRKSRKKDPTVLMGAVKPGTGSFSAASRLKTTGGRKRRRSRSRSIVFVGIVLVLALAGGIYWQINRDPVVSVFEEVAVHEKNDEYSAAIGLLNLLKTKVALNAANMKKVDDKIAALEKSQAALEKELFFRRKWNSYLDLRESGASAEQLLKQIDYLSTIFAEDKNYSMMTVRERKRLSGLIKK